MPNSTTNLTSTSNSTSTSTGVPIEDDEPLSETFVSRRVKDLKDLKDPPSELKHAEYLPRTCYEPIKKIIDSSYVINYQCKILRKELINANLITHKSTYETVMSDGMFNVCLGNTLLLQLPEEIKHSRYGEQIVSDFDLMVNMTNQTLNQFLRGKFGNDVETFEKYQKKLNSNRRSLRRYLNTIQQAIIDGLGLPDTPDKSEVEAKNKKARKEKQMKTKEDLLKQQEELKKQQNVRIYYFICLILF